MPYFLHDHNTSSEDPHLLSAETELTMQIMNLAVFV